MQLPNDELSPKAHEALITCLRIAAKRGKELRLKRERPSQTPMPQDSGTDMSTMPEESDETRATALRSGG